PAPPPPAGAHLLLKGVVAILVAMWIGSAISTWLQSLGLTLPGYIGAMVVAAIVRNIDDATGLVGLPQRTIDDLGSVALSLFIVFALMTLKLWEVAELAIPLIAILAVQVACMVPICIWIVFRLMGRDYDAAVASAGFCGFMLGTTANALANMESLAERYGPAPRAFLVVPMVGAFFIDFSNALIITTFVNLLR
ncbi:MAG: sodium/glutamate symporter, partial [Gemmatimonadetes bacterium]|nr:sodium/glutamate symporter [Gemmatimonadota bacterium]